MKKLLLCVLCGLFLMSCGGMSGTFKYTRPLASPEVNNSVTIYKSKHQVWQEAIPKLGKDFFVINNIDKDSGIINVSYTGDPQQYVNCGTIESTVSNLVHEREYKFPASKAYQIYEATINRTPVVIKRKLTLEGRINIIIEELEPNKTLVSVNVRYLLNKDIKTALLRRSRSMPVDSFSESLAFNTGQADTSGGGTACQCTGALEAKILSLFEQ